MIKTTSEAGRVQLSMRGDVTVILADLTCIIKALHGQLPEKDQAFFRETLQGAVAEGGFCWMSTEKLEKAAAEELAKAIMKLFRPKEAGGDDKAGQS